MIILQENNLSSIFKILFKREKRHFKNSDKFIEEAPTIIFNPQFETTYGFKTPSSKSRISYLLLKKYLLSFEKGGQVNSKDRNAMRYETHLCGYCGNNLSFESSSIDHIFPACLGGKYIFSNIVVCCIPCNQLKGSINKITSPKTYEFFLKFVKRKKAIPKTNLCLLMMAKKYLHLDEKEEESIETQIQREIKRIDDYNKNKYIEIFKQN